MDISSLIPEVFAHAQQTAPDECCGLAVVFKGKLKYMPCRNSLKGDDFFINPEDYVRCEELGEIVGVCHSHVGVGARPSEMDIIGCERTEIPWLIVSLLDNSTHVQYPTGYKPPLVGRTWYHGIQDCYTLVQDYYKTLGIQMSDYPREVEWWAKGYNLYEDNFAHEGFIPQTEPKPHDIILIQNASPVINHAGVYLEGGILLHHCTNRLSSKDVYGGYWRKNTRYILRHESLL